MTLISKELLITLVLVRGASLNGVDVDDDLGILLTSDRSGSDTSDGNEDKLWSWLWSRLLSWLWSWLLSWTWSMTSSSSSSSSSSYHARYRDEVTMTKIRFAVMFGDFFFFFFYCCLQTNDDDGDSV